MKTGELFWGTFFSLLLLVSSCGSGASGTGNSQSYTVGGTVSNLLVDGLVLQNNGCDDIAVAANNDSFTFPTPVADGDGYDITVKTQPIKSQICMVTQATKTVSGANVRNVNVQCVTRFIIKNGD